MSATNGAVAVAPADGISEHARRVIAACDLVRAEGYVVVSKVEHEMWNAWLRDSNERNRRAHDEAQQAIWQVGFLMDRCKDLLGERRPRWWRDARHWWTHYEWTKPIQFGADS